MNISKPTIKKANGVVRVSSTLTTKRGKEFTLWVEVSAEYADFVATDSTALASPFILVASRRNEGLSIEGSVSDRWMNGVSEIMDRVVGWDHGFKPIAVTPESTHEDKIAKSQKRNVGVFFSGGVDSFSSLLRFQHDREHAITHLIFVHGFDIALENTELYNQVAQCMEAISKETGLPCITVRTNIRHITDELLGWEMAHGGALAMVALLLRSGFSKVIIPGGGYTDWQEPWGSSEYLDPRWSTESLQIIHDEDGRMRFEKVRDFIAESDLALKHLRVCWRNNGYNCCSCDKCMMTMAELRAAGVLGKAKTFPSGLDLERLGKMYTTPYSIQQFVEQTHAYLEKLGNDPELTEALGKSLQMSKNPGIKRRLITLIHDLDWKYNESRLFVWLEKRKRSV